MLPSKGTPPVDVVIDLIRKRLKQQRQAAAESAGGTALTGDQRDKP